MTAMFSAALTVMGTSLPDGVRTRSVTMGLDAASAAAVAAAASPPAAVAAAVALPSPLPEGAAASDAATVSQSPTPPGDDCGVSADRFAPTGDA